jgi:hypothetical protein
MDSQAGPGTEAMASEAQQQNGRLDTDRPVERKYVGRRVTPSTFKLDETPDERDERIRATLTMLESLRAKTEEEAAEQRETLELLIKGLNANRPPYAQLFPDQDA